jgi:hypothetical protein
MLLARAAISAAAKRVDSRAAAFSDQLIGIETRHDCLKTFGPRLSRQSALWVGIFFQNDSHSASHPCASFNRKNRLALGSLALSAAGHLRENCREATQETWMPACISLSGGRRETGSNHRQGDERGATYLRVCGSGNLRIYAALAAS